MRSLKRINLSALLILAVVLSACTPKNIILHIPSDLTARVAKANQSVCDYKGRVSVIYENGKDDVRFKGLLDKDCEDNFHLKILGLFGSVAYDVKYENGLVEAYEKGEDISLEMAYFMRSKGLESMVSLIRYPHVKIDDTFKVKAVVDEYILTRGLTKVAVGQDFLIKRIEFGSESFKYFYTENQLSALIYEGEGTKVEIRLR